MMYLRPKACAAATASRKSADGAKSLLARGDWVPGGLFYRQMRRLSSLARHVERGRIDAAGMPAGMTSTLHKSPAAVVPDTAER